MVTFLWPVQTGDYSRRFRRQFVAENGDCRQKRRLAELGDYSHQCGQGFSRRAWLSVLVTDKFYWSVTDAYKYNYLKNLPMVVT